MEGCMYSTVTTHKDIIISLQVWLQLWTFRLNNNNNNKAIPMVGYSRSSFITYCLCTSFYKVHVKQQDWVVHYLLTSITEWWSLVSRHEHHQSSHQHHHNKCHLQHRDKQQRVSYHGHTHMDTLAWFNPIICQGGSECAHLLRQTYSVNVDHINKAHQYFTTKFENYDGLLFLFPFLLSTNNTHWRLKGKTVNAYQERILLYIYCTTIYTEL